MIPYMHAIEFNTWMTLLSMMRERVQDPTMTKYVTVKPDNVLPQFPRDLSKFAKPSIIVQKVAMDQSDFCFGKGFIGQVYDEENGLLDVFSRQHEMTFQYDVFADTNTQESLMSGMITDIFSLVRNIPILDFTGEGEPTEMGVAKVDNSIDIMPLNSNENRDYRTAIRIYLTVIQTLVPKQETVDLAKWIKVTQHVKL